MAVAVAIRSVEVDRPDPGSISVEITVTGGEGRVRLFLHVDGEPVGTWDGGSGLYTFRAPLALRPRRVVTARAVDRNGAWGGASASFSAVGAPLPVPVLELAARV
jgi:hypothetical protein